MEFLTARRGVVLVIAMLASVSAACGGSADRTPRVLNVPADYPTIQKAVDEAKEGDSVLVAAGTYREAVTISTKGIVLRGADRNKVVLDGEDERENGVLVEADDVAVENLTVLRYTVNGLLFSKAYLDDGLGATGEIPLLRGFRARYITAANNGLYGIYAFNSTHGVIEDSYASGHPDSGIYVGQCKPCDTVVQRVTAETNAVGYEGTNASGKLYVVESRFMNNRIGMTPNTQRTERLAPQGNAVLAANLVANNNNPDAPAARTGFGIGIAVGGGTANEVLNNTVRDNQAVGILVDDLDDFAPSGNQVIGNSLGGNGVDLSLGGFTTPPTSTAEAKGNCFAENTFSTSLPAAIETLSPCANHAASATGALGVLAAPNPPKDVDYRNVALPPDQPTMPAAEMASYPRVGDPPKIEVAKLTTPTS